VSEALAKTQAVPEKRPPEEEPHRRLVEHGSEVLSNAEVVSILFGGGRSNTRELAKAREVVRSHEGVAGLVGRSMKELRFRGISQKRATALLAAVEFGRRLAQAKLPERKALKVNKELAEYLALRYIRPGQEVMGAMYTNARDRLLGERELVRGTLNRASVEPRSILKEGLLLDAAKVLVFHTHPSGDPAPSIEDLSFTRRLNEACDAVGVELVDHLILGSPTRWVSLRQRCGAGF
jgi:DNA repair protein RadC